VRKNKHISSISHPLWITIVFLLFISSFLGQDTSLSDAGTIALLYGVSIVLNIGLWRLLKLHLAYRRTKKIQYWTLWQKSKFVIYIFFTLMMFAQGVVGGILYLVFFLGLVFFILRSIWNWFKSFTGSLPSLSFRTHTNHESFSIDHIDQMNGTDFETFIAELYDTLGYFSEVTPPSGDFGADVITVKDKTKTAIQTKCYGDGRTVGIEAINEVLGGAGYWNATRKMVITNRYFTKAAISSAERNNVELIDREGLKKLLQEYHDTLEEKFNFGFLPKWKTKDG
jgi:hypothetical protein